MKTADFLDRLRREMGFDPGSSAEEQAKKLGKDLEAFAVSQGKLVASTITKSARRAGVPRSATGYLFWLLVERSHQWPPMDSASHTALSRAVWLMEKANATPSYSSGFEVPPEEVEDAIEAAIKAIAAWAKGPLRGSLLRKYMKLLTGYKTDIRSQVEGTFLAAVLRHPRWFAHPDLLHWAMKPFLG